MLSSSQNYMLKTRKTYVYCFKIDFEYFFYNAF